MKWECHNARNMKEVGNTMNAVLELVGGRPVNHSQIGTGRRANGLALSLSFPPSVLPHTLKPSFTLQRA